MADAQYVIDIAAEMPEGELTIDQLDQLTAEMTGAGKDAAFFSEAMSKVDKQLGQAREAAVAATDALAEGRSEYRLLERAALQSAKAAERAAVKHGGIVPAELHQKAEAANAALAKHTNILRRLEREAEQATGAENDLTKTMRNVNRLTKHSSDVLGDATTRLSTFRGALGDVGGPLGELGEKVLFPAQGFVDLSETMGKGRAAMVVAAVGAVALTAAVAALGVAAIVASVQIAQWGVSMADASRSANLAEQAALALSPELEQLGGQFAALEEETNLSTGRLHELSRGLRDAKVSAEDMPGALRAAALAEAALGSQGSAQFLSNIKEGKGAVADLAAEAQAKLGGIVAKQMLGLENQGKRFERLWGNLFDSIQIEPALLALDKLVGLFEEGTASAEAMKVLLGGIFEPFLGQADDLATSAEAIALKVLIEFTKLYIAAKPWIQRLADLTSDTFALMAEHSDLVVLTLEGLGVAIGAVALVGAALVVAIGAIGAALGHLMRQAIRTVEMWVFMGEALAGFAVDAVEFGGDLIAGLVKGITDGASDVWEAISGVVTGGIDRAKELLGIASPSKVFAGIGEDTGEGFVRGVESKQGDSGRAVDSLVMPEQTRRDIQRGGSSGGDGGGAPVVAQDSPGGGATINLAGATFNFSGVANAEEAEERFGDMLMRFLEGDARTVGGAT